MGWIRYTTRLDYAQGIHGAEKENNGRWEGESNLRTFGTTGLTALQMKLHNSHCSSSFVL